jgi:hypothetical protein
MNERTNERTRGLRVIASTVANLPRTSSQVPRSLMIEGPVPVVSNYRSIIELRHHRNTGHNVTLTHEDVMCEGGSTCHHAQDRADDDEEKTFLMKILDTLITDSRRTGRTY